MKSCRQCGKPINRGRLCQSCRSLYDKGNYEKKKTAHIASRTERKRELVKWYRELKTGRACADCGASGLHFSQLDFDHLPGRIKLFEISWAVRNGISKERIQAELEKVQLVCKNCHALRTWQRLMGKRGSAIEYE